MDNKRFQKLVKSNGEFSGYFDTENGKILFQDGAGAEQWADDVLSLLDEVELEHKNQSDIVNRNLNWFRQFVAVVNYVELNVEDHSSWVASLRYDFDEPSLFVTTQAGATFEIQGVDFDDYMDLYRMIEHGWSVGSYVNVLKKMYKTR